jgi:hypothetical protein
MKKKIKCINSAAVSLSLKEGNVYESEWEDNDYFYINMEGTLTALSKNRFEEVKEESNVLDNIRKELEEARKLVGKTIIHNDGFVKYDVGEVGLHIYKEPTEGISLSVQGEAKTRGYCVYIISKNGKYSNPYKAVEVVQDFVDIVLNDQYSAKVYKDKVVVGCQTFTMDKVKEILDAGNKLK